MFYINMYTQAMRVSFMAKVLSLLMVNMKLWEEATFYFNELKCHVSFKQDHRLQTASVLNEKGESVCNINQTP